MKRFLAVVIASHALFLISAIVFTADQMNEVLRGVLIIGCGLGVLRWIVGAWQAAKSSGERASMAILAVVTLLTGLLTVSVYSVLYVRFGRPDLWTTLYWSPYFTALEVAGVILLVVSTHFQGERPSKLGAPLTALVAFIGVMFTALGPWLLTKIGWLFGMLMHVMPK